MKSGKKHEPYPLEQMIESLRQDAEAATRYIGYLKAVVDQEVVAQKLAHSFSGHALATATSAVKQALILYCARTWEKAPTSENLKPVISIPAAIARLQDPELIQFDLQMRFPEDTSLSAEERLERLLRLEQRIYHRHAKMIAAYGDLVAEAAHGPLRVLRTENYAHLAINSHDRQGLEKAGLMSGTTWNDLLRVSEATVHLVGELGYFWDRSSNPYQEWIKTAHRQCREFWRILPVLGDVEDPAIG